MYDIDEITTTRVKAVPVVWEQKSAFSGHTVVATDPATGDRIEGVGGAGTFMFFPAGKGEGIEYNTGDLLPDMRDGC